MQSVICASQRIVVKVGSSLVTNDGKGLDHAALTRWAGEIADLARRGKQVVLVSSGAIAEGLQRLGWSTRPKAVHELQAAAAVGQMGLIIMQMIHMSAVRTPIRIKSFAFNLLFMVIPPIIKCGVVSII